MANAASAPTELPSASPKSDLKMGTIERIARIKTKPLEDGVNVETQELSGDRAKLETYRNLKTEFVEKISERSEAAEWQAVIAAGQDFRRPLAAKLKDGRAPKESE